MAKNEIPKISDFQSLGLCDGFAKVGGGWKIPVLDARSERPTIKAHQLLWAQWEQIKIVSNEYEVWR